MNGEEFALNLLRFLRVFLRGDYSISTILLPGGPIIQAWALSSPCLQIFQWPAKQWPAKAIFFYCRFQ